MADAPGGADAADAIAVADGRILVVGPAEEVRRLRGERTRVLDFPGATIVPGLVDAHTHPIYSLGIVRGASLVGVKTLDGLVEALARAREEQAEDECFFAWGLDPSAFEGRPVGHGVLHEVLGADRPAYVKLFDAHAAIASAAALERAGVTASHVADDGSAVVDDGTGRPSGHLIEFPAMDLVEKALPPLTFEDRVRALLKLLHGWAALGITTAHVMDLKDPDALDLLAAIEADGDLPVRLRLSPWCTPDTDDAAAERLVAQQGQGGRQYRVEGIKFFIDGVVEAGTAWLDTPDSLGAGTASGWPDPDVYTRRVRFFHAHGIPTATHAIGEHGIRFAATTLAALDDAEGAPQHRIEHIESTDDETIALIAANGIAASMQPTHCTHHVRADGSDEWSRRLGRARAARAWRTADLRRAGATVALGSDWPVAQMDPWGILADAQLRRSVDQPDAEPIAASQALTAREALEGYTTHAHRSIGADGGRLEPGAVADVVIVDRDPLTASPADVARTRVLLTMLQGRVTHLDA